MVKPRLEHDGRLSVGINLVAENNPEIGGVEIVRQAQIDYGSAPQEKKSQAHAGTTKKPPIQPAPHCPGCGASETFLIVTRPSPGGNTRQTAFFSSSSEASRTWVVKVCGPVAPGWAWGGISQ